MGHKITPEEREAARQVAAERAAIAARKTRDQAHAEAVGRALAPEGPCPECWNDDPAAGRKIGCPTCAA